MNELDRPLLDNVIFCGILDFGGCKFFPVVGHDFGKSMLVFLLELGSRFERGQHALVMGSPRPTFGNRLTSTLSCPYLRRALRLYGLAVHASHLSWGICDLEPKRA
jgi:hypothetical protein